MNIKEIAERAHNHAVKIGAYGDDSENAINLKIFEESNELRTAIEENRYKSIEEFVDLFGDLEGQDFAEMFEKYIKNSIGDEFADNHIVLFGGAVELGVNSLLNIKMKLKYNEIREDHNGKNS